MKYSICLLSFFVYFAVAIAEYKDGVCDNCVRREQCDIFRNMSPTQQYAWINKYPCTKILYKGFYIPYRNGIYVCCSERLWAAETGYGYGGDKRNDNGLSRGHPGTATGGDTQNNPDNYQNYYTTGPSVNPGVSNQNPISDDPNVNVKPGGVEVPVTRPPNYNYDATLPTTESEPVTQEHCPATIFPPVPDSGCCGIEASDEDRILVTTSARPVYPTSPPYILPERSPTNTDLPIIKEADTTVNVTIDTRIAGGEETSFYQFPWTAQLIITFAFGNRRQAYDCGGSLISSRYILTAGHCVYDPAGILKKVDAYLAEYDRTTFPKDCRYVLNYGQECIENVVISAEEVVRHPDYDDDKLFNDIALVRLRKNAPYTPFIRPICLTPVNVDDTKFTNLRLAVAGWGRNGRHRSNIKQSTILNLVHQEQCKKYYPHLITSQMCAVGYSGQDTCKGDSGGPLMTLIDGEYYVVGIVSGKRADAPCGTAVPSLFTNVYQFVPWILRNIRYK